MLCTHITFIKKYVSASLLQDFDSLSEHTVISTPICCQLGCCHTAHKHTLRSGPSLELLLASGHTRASAAAFQARYETAVAAPVVSTVWEARAACSATATGLQAAHMTQLECVSYMERQPGSELSPVGMVAAGAHWLRPSLERWVLSPCR